MASYTEVLPPLHQAVKDNHHLRVLQRLALGDDPNRLAEVEGYGTTCTPIYIAVRNRGDSVLLTKSLIDYGADANILTGQGEAVLHMAVTYGDIEVCNLLLQAGAAVDHVGGGNSTALRVAALLHDVRILELLLFAGATVDLISCQQRTALMDAAEKGSEGCVRALLKAAADPFRVDEEGLTSLHIAAHGKWTETDTMKSMIRCSRLRSDGPTIPQYVKVLDLLVKAGLDVNALSHTTLTPLMGAHDVAVVKSLIEGGASVTAVDTHGNNVMHHAADKACGKKVIDVLYQAGANPSRRNLSGQTPADLARAKNQNATARLLDMLATRYCDKEASVSNDQRPAETPCKVSSELEDKMKAIAVDSCESNTDSKVPEEAEAEQSCEEAKEEPSASTETVKEEKQHKVLQPCLHCQTLTHRRCGRCKITFFCDRSCQMATMAVHKPICLQIYEERERSKAERRAKKEEEA